MPAYSSTGCSLPATRRTPKRRSRLRDGGNCEAGADVDNRGRDAIEFGGTLWDKQVVRHKLATLATRAEAFRHLTYHCAWLVSEGRDCVKEVSMLKALGGELVNRTMYDCVQLHGGMGYMRESPIERMSRDARVASIGGGATEVMLEEVAKRM
ncbi:MAG: hypothetical protein F4092_10480 [Rhodospirillaceae bacterium]|nr:hypothetical protein [Rhodospirillaceae bacterium]